MFEILTKRLLTTSLVLNNRAKLNKEWSGANQKIPYPVLRSRTEAYTSSHLDWQQFTKCTHIKTK